MLVNVRTSTLVVCLLVGFLVLAGCGGAQAPQAAAPTATPTATTTPVTMPTPSPPPTVSLSVDFSLTPTPTLNPRPVSASDSPDFVIPTSAPTAAPPAPGVVTHGGNLRSEPRIAPDTVLGQLCPGDRVRLLERQELDEIVWLHVSVAAVGEACVTDRAPVAAEGWVSSVLVDENAPAAAQQSDGASAPPAPANEPFVLLPPTELISGTYTLESNLKLPVTVSGEQLDEFIAAVYPESPLIGLGETWVSTGQHYRINPIYLLAHAIEASNWGTSEVSRELHNVYHWGTNAACGERCAESYHDMATGVFATVGFLNRDYLALDGVNYHGATLRGLQQGYAADPEWAQTVVGYMNWIAAFLDIEALQATPEAIRYADDVRLVQPACFQVVRAALTAPGKPYTQAMGRRSGPDSFDCSGMVWWAYQQADITADPQGRAFGTNTYTQIFNGSRIDCTLDDINGAQTTCWSPGDLAFIRYPGGQHVSLYVGKGLFSDCYSQQMGCILHDISDNSFYHQYFWQARRVLPDCAGVLIDPATLVQDASLITWEDREVTAPGR